MIINQNHINKIIRSLLLFAFRRLENNDNPNFNTNGERLFVNNLFAYFNKLEVSKLILFDVGANIGTYTQLLLDHVTHRGYKYHTEIHVFEPMPGAFIELKHKFLNLPQVILNNAAASNRTGEAEIFFDNSQSRLASLYQRNLDDAIGIKLERSDMVESIRLDGYITAKNITHINFLKLDIEGHELAAMEGMGSYLTKDFVDFIQFEYGGASLDSHTSLQNLYGLLEKAGFVVTKVMPKGLEIRKYKSWMDNFQYANYVAVSEDIVKEL